MIAATMAAIRARRRNRSVDQRTVSVCVAIIQTFHFVTGNGCSNACGHTIRHRITTVGRTDCDLDRIQVVNWWRLTRESDSGRGLSSEERSHIRSTSREHRQARSASASLRRQRPDPADLLCAPSLDAPSLNGDRQTDTTSRVTTMVRTYTRSTDHQGRSATDWSLLRLLDHPQQ